MPYIQHKQKYTVDGLLDKTITLVQKRRSAGFLNYVITRLVLGFLGGNPNYERYNSVIGVLESAKLELYRRAVAVYEDEKIEENGDVY